MIRYNPIFKLDESSEGYPLYLNYQEVDVRLAKIADRHYYAEVLYENLQISKDNKWEHPNQQTELELYPDKIVKWYIPEDKAREFKQVVTLRSGQRIRRRFPTVQSATLDRHVRGRRSHFPSAC